MRENMLREKINNNDITIGTRIITPWAGLFEFIGCCDEIEYIEYSGEYSPFNLELLNNIGRACEVAKIGSLFKVDQSLQTFMAQRALGAGFDGVLFTDIRTVEDVKECIRAVRPETPKAGGINPAFVRRCTGYMKEAGSPQFVKAMEDAVVAIMIEKESAVDDIENILSVKGIDMIQFGSSDYSMSIGMPGQRHLPEIKDIEKRVINLALEKGITPRAEINSPVEAEEYIKLGVRHFNIGKDMGILYDWLDKSTKEVKGLLNKTEYNYSNKLSY